MLPIMHQKSEAFQASVLSGGPTRPEAADRGRRPRETERDPGQGGRGLAVSPALTGLQPG